MSIATAYNAGKLICKAFGISTKNVTSIEISIAPNDIVRVTIGRAATVEEFEKVVEVLKKYHLKEDDTTPFITGKDPIETFE